MGKRSKKRRPSKKKRKRKEERIRMRLRKAPRSFLPFRVWPGRKSQVFTFFFGLKWVRGGWRGRGG